MTTAPNFTCQNCGLLRTNSEASMRFKRWCWECAEEAMDEAAEYDGWEDPAVEYAREQAEARQDRYEMWRREY